MEISENCTQLCSHISALTGANCSLLSLVTKDFLTQPFRSGCAFEGTACTASCTHLFGAYEAQRWEGKYMYYCPRGLLFIAALPQVPDELNEYCLVTGPILMTNSADDPFDDPLSDPSSLEGIPHLTTVQVGALCELVAAALSPFPHSRQALGSSGAMLQTMYDYAVAPSAKDYPIESEHKLQEHIREGNKDAAQKLLNELLAQLYASTGNDLAKIKPRIRELLVLMNRAAIDGGADADEVFSLCRRYDCEVDSLGHIEDLNRWLGLILHQFIGFVFDFNTIKHQNIIFKITAYIKEHLAERITLDQVAAQVYLSKSYFCRIIKNELGCTFTEYVNHLRIERSKNLLRSTRMPIAEISIAVGFDDQSYFTRIFKKQTGTSPGKYREQRGTAK